MSSVADEQESLDQAVFSLLVASHPALWSREEVVRQITAADADDFASRDAVENSLRDLVGYGLLHRTGELYLATRPAIHAVRLSG